MNLDTYRSQVMAERARANREDVRRLNASLNETRDLIARTQRAIPNNTDQQKLLETMVQVEVDPVKRAQLEFELKRAKDGVDQYKAQLETFKEREQQLTAELRNAQIKLDELETRLDLLDRAIESDRQKLDGDKSAQKPSSP
jgi:predicted  nucleic acid-binding Zn-ribbon protein